MARSCGWPNPGGRRPTSGLLMAASASASALAAEAVAVRSGQCSLEHHQALHPELPRARRPVRHLRHLPLLRPCRSPAARQMAALSPLAAPSLTQIQLAPLSLSASEYLPLLPVAVAVAAVAAPTASPYPLTHSIPHSTERFQARWRWSALPTK